jgi:hypothetical protein
MNEFKIPSEVKRYLTIQIMTYNRRRVQFLRRLKELEKSGRKLKFKKYNE